MKNKLYVSLVVALLCLFWGTEHAQLQRSNPARQTWEYKTLTLSRSTIETGWTEWLEDNKTLPLPINGVAKMAELGNQGWEFVGVVPIGGTTGGATTSVTQYYKRPK